MIKNVAVYLGSKPGKSPVFLETAYQMGELLATHQYHIIYGGANVGTMKALADGALQGGGRVTGVFPDNFKGKKEVREQGIEIEHNRLSEMIKVQDMQQRKRVMEQMSDCCIILPGSFGTLDELFEYAVHHQLGYHSKPIIILNTNGYYTPMRDLINNMRVNGFIPPQENIFIYCDTAKEVLDVLERANGIIP